MELIVGGIRQKVNKQVCIWYMPNDVKAYEGRHWIEGRV